ncbi:MAG: cation transporter [Halomonas sp.]|nr:cation transporter [Halomonas sp.]
MHHHEIDIWKHEHTFDQDKVRSGERQTLIVMLLTLVTMFIEIIAGVIYGSMALLADGLQMGSHATALGIAAFAYAYARRHAGHQPPPGNCSELRYNVPPGARLIRG